MPRNSWQYWLSAILLPVSAALYTSSLFLEIFRIERSMKILGMGKIESESYRLFGAISHLWRDGEIGLAIIIAAFSFVFPVGKYLALTFVMLTRSDGQRRRVTTWVKNLGQWSMGDVFVVALMVVIVRVNNSIAQLGVEPRTGLWVFAASVLLGMIVSALLGFVVDRPTRTGESAGRGGSNGSGEDAEAVVASRSSRP